jgi:hypothetical protein
MISALFDMLFEAGSLMSALSCFVPVIVYVVILSAKIQQKMQGDKKKGKIFLKKFGSFIKTTYLCSAF